MFASNNFLPNIITVQICNQFLVRNANIPKQPPTNYSENSIKRTYCSIPTIFQHGFFYKTKHNKKESPVLSEERPHSLTKPFISSIFASPFFANPSTKSKKKKKNERILNSISELNSQSKETSLEGTGHPERVSGFSIISGLEGSTKGRPLKTRMSGTSRNKSLLFIVHARGVLSTFLSVFLVSLLASRRFVSAILSRSEHLKRNRRCP